MPDLSVAAIGVAIRPCPDYRPLAALAGVDHVVALARVVAEATGVPMDQLRMRAPDDGLPDDLGAEALAALGPAAPGQPLFLVRSGPLRDPYVAELARLVHVSGWTGDAIGITHLDELGGTVVFGLLDWAVPAESGATVLISDEPAYADALAGVPPAAAVGLWLRRGPGPLRVLGGGEGAPPATAADRRFTGSGPCDGWVALRAALATGEVADGDRLLLHTQGPTRSAWLSLLAVDVAALLPTTPCLTGGHR